MQEDMSRASPPPPPDYKHTQEERERKKKEDTSQVTILVTYKLSSSRPKLNVDCTNIYIIKEAIWSTTLV